MISKNPKQALLEQQKRLTSMKGLEEKLRARDTKPKEEKVPKWKRALYYFLMLFGLLQALSGSYLFAETLFSLIPGLVYPGVIALSFIFVALDGILFYAFEGAVLKEAFGFPVERGTLTAWVNTLHEQLEAVKAINSHLTNVEVLSRLTEKEYKQYAQEAIQFNQNISEIQKQLEAYQEPKKLKFFKAGVIFLGVISSVAFCFFC